MQRIRKLGALGITIAILALLTSTWLEAKEPQAETSAVSIPTPRGVELEGVLHRPAEASSVVVVIGSGRGYHMDLPFLKRTAEELQKVGITALRFNWAYFTAKGKHSPDLSVELEDLEAAIEYARKIEGVEHVVLAGKSLGSVAAAMRAQKKSDDLAGLMLLTYPIHSPEKSDAVFPLAEWVQSWKKPLLIACGDADPYSELGPLYKYAAGFEQAPRLVIAPGDHGFNGPGGREDKAATLKNVDLAAHGIARWCRLWADDLAAGK